MDRGSSSPGHRTIRSPQPGSIQSDQQTEAPLTKGDLAIVVFVSSLWLWAAVWAMTVHYVF